MPAHPQFDPDDETVELTETPPLLEIAFPYGRVRFRWLVPVVLLIAIALIVLTKCITLTSTSKTIILALGFILAGLSVTLIRYLFNWKDKPGIVEGLAPYTQQFTFSLHKDDSVRTRAIRKHVKSFEPSIYTLRHYSINAVLAPLTGRFSISVFFVLIICALVLGDINFIFALAFVLLSSVGIRLYALLRPTYFRISPGYLEILRGWPWNDSIARLAAISLYDKRIHIDLDSALLVLIDQEEELALIGIGGVMRYDLMLEPIFEAAACGEVPLQTDPQRLVG